jgi:hypothetical protein
LAEAVTADTTMLRACVEEIDAAPADVADAVTPTADRASTARYGHVGRPRQRM